MAYREKNGHKVLLMTCALLSSVLISATANQANAKSFLHGQNSGLQKCVRAVLHGYSVKHVEIFGRKYNCKALGTYKNGWRRVQISHHRRLGQDDQFYVDFRVDAKNVMRPDTIDINKKRGVSVQATLDGFRGTAGPPRDYQTVAARANEVRQIKYPKHWEQAPWYVALVTIAELGNPENRGTAPRQVSCRVPTFHAYDNFGGRAYTAKRGEYPNIHKDSRFRGLGDAMSSLCVPRGFVVHFYEHDTFKGKMWEVVGGKEFYDLGRQKKDFQDRISSFKVFENTKITGGSNN